MKTRRAFLLALAITAAPLCRAQGLPVARPESAGLSAARLARLGETMKRYVDEGKLAGVVTLVARDGRLAHLEAFGHADLEKNAAMQKDSIFRIASMSKAVTSVAVMMLVEEGKLLISDPVSRYVPAFKSTTVADGAASVPAKRPINIRDLLTHTAGISYGSDATRASYKAAGLDEWYFADKAEPIGHWIERLAGLPFDAQPGERYVYGYSTDILGHVVEKAAGVSLDELVTSRILRPLKMTDTHFFLPRQKRARLTAVYAAKGSGIERAPDTGRSQGAYVDGPRACFSGGAGLVSTAGDYARFLQMLLNGGELDGVRLLSPKTVELMTSNHVGSLYNEGRFGFGLGFEITEHVGRSGRHGSVGEFGWGGAYFTRFWVDPQERLVAVFMAQLLPSGGLDLQNKFRALVYQALDTSAAWPASRPAAAAARRP